MSDTYLRIKLRKNQSTLPMEKLHSGLKTLEILGDSIETLPSLEHLTQCEQLLLVCPNLSKLAALPENLKILKIKGGQVIPPSLPKNLETLQLSGIKGQEIEYLELPQGLYNIDLSNNQLTNLREMKFAPTLQRINLDHNALKELPESIYQSKSILHLSLDGNPLSDEQKDRIFKTFGIF